MRIAVIGDIHLFRLRVHPRRLIGKRLLGQSNLWLNRRFRFNHDLLEPLIAHTRELEPDMVLLTGDVTTTSLEDEFDDIVRYFKPLAEQAPVVMVPGNHDRYTFRSARKRRMEAVLRTLMPTHFPHFQRLEGAWHLLALDSARPQWMLSRGALGMRQLREARQHLNQLGPDDGLIVLCHYPTNVPPGTPRSWAHDMADARLLQRLLHKCPARTVFVHGHIHKPWHWDEPSQPGHQTTFLNAGAPCLTSGHYPLGQGMWEIEIPATAHEGVTLVHHVPTQRGQYGMSRMHLASELDPSWHAREVT